MKLAHLKLLKFYNMKTSNYLNNFNRAFLILLVFLLGSCSKKEEIKPDVKPITINTLPAGNVIATVATLNAEIGYLNDEKIIDYGFILFEQTSNNSKKISLGSNPKAGLIQYDYKPDKNFGLNQILNYRFYLITERFEYMGNIVSFRVKDFWVDQKDIIPISLGDTLTLTGNFKQISPDEKVIANGIYNPAQIEIINVEPSKLQLKIPYNLGKHGDRVNLIIGKFQNQNDINTSSLVSINLLGKIEFDVDKPIYYGEGLKIRSYGIDYFSNFFVVVGNNRLELGYDNPNIITLKGIKNNGQKLRLGYFNGKDTIFSNKKLELIPPVSSEITFKQTLPHPGYFFTINKSVLTKYYGEDPYIIKIGDSTAAYSYYSYEPDAGYYLPSLKVGNYVVQIVSDLYPPIKLNNQIEIKPIAEKIINQKPYYYGDIIEMSGNFIDGHEYIAKVSDYELMHVKAANGKLKFTLPHGKFGKNLLTIGLYQEPAGYKFPNPGIPIEINKSVVESVSPSIVYQGDVVTLKGKGFKNLFSVRIYYAGNECKLLSISETEIKFMAPSVSRKGKFPIELEFLDNETITTTQLLEIK